jgi:hypothetical protein
LLSARLVVLQKGILSKEASIKESELALSFGSAPYLARIPQLTAAVTRKTSTQAEQKSRVFKTFIELSTM